VCLKIKDSGIGMSKIVMEHVFEPFFTTKPVDKGTGLGLATTHGVMTQHSAALIIDSMLGKGTTFELYFPVSSKIIEQERTPANEISASNSEFCSARLLLVEDQEDVRDMTSKMLMRLGYEVITAESGLKALKILKSQMDGGKSGRPFDLVISDHSMPKMTGLELAVQASIDFPKLPFLILSGYSESKIRKVIEDTPNVKAILRKPISKDALKRQIEATLLRSQNDESTA
jgi:CheY-like chemotaxis protein